MEEQTRNDSTEACHQEGLSAGVEDQVVESETVEELKRELEDYRAQYLRALADLDNFKKRARREKAEQLQFANQKLAYDLLPVLDNLESAVRSSQAAVNSEALASGVELIHRQLVATLERHGVRPIAAMGQPFDPRLHEAVGRAEGRGASEGTVVEEVVEGYMMHDRVLRHSKVIVASGKEPESTPEQGTAAEEQPWEIPEED